MRIERLNLKFAKENDPVKIFGPKEVVEKDDWNTGTGYRRVFSPQQLLTDIGATELNRSRIRRAKSDTELPMDELLKALTNTREHSLKRNKEVKKYRKSSLGK